MEHAFYQENVAYFLTVHSNNNYLVIYIWFSGFVLPALKFSARQTISSCSLTSNLNLACAYDVTCSYDVIMRKWRIELSKDVESPSL